LDFSVDIASQKFGKGPYRKGENISLRHSKNSVLKPGTRVLPDIQGKIANKGSMLTMKEKSMRVSHDLN
jgi:hypothetical protein